MMSVINFIVLSIEMGVLFPMVMMETLRPNCGLLPLIHLIHQSRHPMPYVSVQLISR